MKQLNLLQNENLGFWAKEADPLRTFLCKYLTS